MGLGLDAVRLDERFRCWSGVVGPRQRARLCGTAADAPGLPLVPPPRGGRGRSPARRRARRRRARDPGGAGSAHPASRRALGARLLRGGGRHVAFVGGGGAMWRVTALVVALATVPAVPVRAAGTPPVAYVLMDADSGTVLAEHESHKRWPPASMAKMMTVLIAMERVRDHQLSFDEPVRASAWASRIGGSQVYLAEGESFPLGEMLKAIMIASANDAAVAVAEHIAGSTAGFVELMNERAKTLGLADTTYQSVHGLPPGKGQTADLTSAHDLAVLGRELMRFPDVMRWAGTASAGFRNDTLQMANTNHLVRTYSGATGLKTGYYREDRKSTRLNSSHLGISYAVFC